MLKVSTGLPQYALKANKLPAVFEVLQSCVATALSVVDHSHPATIVIVVESVISEMSNTDAMVADVLPASGTLPYMTLAVPVRKREKASKITKLRKKRRRNTAKDPATALVKKKNMLRFTEPARMLHLSSEYVVVPKALLQAVPTVSSVYTENFCNTHETRAPGRRGFRRVR